MTDFFKQRVESRDIKIPFQQRRNHSMLLVSMLKQLPNRINYICTMGIDNQIFCFIIVTGNMQVSDTFTVKCVNISLSVITVINAVYLDVIHIK